MILRLLLTLFLLTSLSAKEDSWYNKIDVELEAGIYTPSFNGNVENIIGTSSFEDDFNYDNTVASYFSANIAIDYKYVPYFYIGYIRLADNTSSTLTKKVKIADGEFSSGTASILEYDVLHFIVYDQVKIKGKYVSIYGKKIYSGDLEFDIGMNLQLLFWKFNVLDVSTSTSTRPSSWIEIAQFIPVPFFGLRYYWYDFTTYINSSALAFGTAKSITYQYGLDYTIVENLSVSAGYIYNQFEALEEIDNINFTMRGYRFSFKYAF